MILSGSPRDIAILRLDNLGDAILTGGLLAALRRAWPDARITVFCAEAGYPFFSRCAAVNAVHRLRPLDPPHASPAEADAVLAEFNRAYADEFDLLINPRSDPDYYFAGGYAAASQTPVRIAFRQTMHPHGIDTDVVYTHLLEPPPVDEHPAWTGRHILSALGLATALDPPSLSPSNRATDRARAILPGGPCVALGIGASQSNKIWPPENFAAVADGLAGRGFQSILVGTLSEQSLAKTVERISSAQPLNLVGQTPLDDLAAAIGRCAAFVGNDSAPKHVAAAMGVPVVDILFRREGVPAGARDSKFRALGVRNIRINPSRDFDEDGVAAGRAIRSISPVEVLAAFDRLLATNAQASHLPV